MRIQHNIAAMSSYRNYTNNVAAVNKNLEKLSSGYKINRAGDDAAGLAISEKMRAQITGLEAAQKNAKDGISLVKTAEGALQEVHDMLNRMVSLATQSANGTYDNETDRYQLQKEVDQLRSEINRIADSANFNGIKLFDGTMEADKVEYKITGDAALGILSTAGADNTKAGTSTVLHTNSTSAAKTKFYVDLSNISFTSSGAISTGNSDFGISVGSQTIVTGLALAKGEALGGEDLAKALAAKAATLNGNKGFMVSGISYTVTAEGSKLVFEMADASFDLIKNDSTKKASFNGNFDIDIVAGANSKAGYSGTVNGMAQMITEGTPKINGNLANTETAAAVTADFYADGKTLTVGDVTYVFVSKQSTLDMVKEAGTKYVAVDLTDISKDGALDNTTAQGAGYANALTEAGARLTRAAENNKMFSVGHGATDGTLAFQEREDYNGNGKGGRADLTTLDGIKAQLRTGTFSKEVIAAANGTGKGLTLQIGDTADSYNQLKVSLGDMHCSSLGIDGISIADQGDAQSAIDAIKKAINTVSDVRGTLGATQNRLDHTINNLSVMRENIQDAESTIRDTDIAEEMMAYTKNNILVQSAQAMLAQANQIPQGVLQLLG